MTTKTKILIGIIFILSIFVYVKAFAVQITKMELEPQNDFVVEPGKTEVFLNPGESVTKNIIVTNRIGDNIKFKLSSEDIVGTNDPLSPVKLLGDEKGPYSLKDFIKPEVTEFTLNLGERITIPVTISVPADAEPRGYYGALIVSNEPYVLDNENNTGQAKLVSRIGALFLLRINGEGKESGNLEDFRILGPHKLFYQERPEGFEISFKNTGNVHLVPHGKIAIRNMFGKEIGSIPVDAYFSLPDSIRYREVMWSKGVGLGRYTAQLSFYPGYGSENQEASLSFWIIPWKLLIIVFVSLVVLISIIYYILTRFEIKKK